MADRFSADPTVVFMTAVLDDIEAGRLLIPRFQRPLVWSWVQRRDFLNSIYEGLPIGALMIWVSDGEPVSIYDALGPHPLPTPHSLSGEHRYLMDGVQRISTLYGAMRATKNWEMYDPSQQVSAMDFIIYADLDADQDQDRFVRFSDINLIDYVADTSRYFPLHATLDSKDFLRFQRTISPDREDRLEKSDNIVSAFRNYKVPIISLKSASLEVVTKSFERVNSRGADMSELHMLNALSYSTTFDLLGKDAELRSDVLAQRLWDDVDQEVVLRCIKLRLRLDIYKTDPDELSSRLKANPHVMDEVFTGLAKAADFFKGWAGITRPELVPYRMQIVGVASILIDYPDPNSSPLADWFWVSTYTEAFGSSARRSEDALGDLFRYATSGQFKWTLRENPSVRPLTNLRVDFRAARVKALALALWRCRNMYEPNTSSTTFGRDAFTQVVFDRDLRGRAGLRFMLSSDEVAAFKHRLQHGQMSSSEAAAHLISPEALSAAYNGNWKLFCDIREEYIFYFEKSQVLGPAAERIGLMISNMDAHSQTVMSADLFGDE